MARIEWNTRLATYHPTIDEQHKGLLEAFNALQEALNRGTDKAEVARKLTHLQDFTVHHFRAEQGLMERAGYPRYGAHLALHEELLAQVADVCAAFEEDRVSMSPTMMGFLEEWLIEHIQDEDVKLADWLRSEGKA